MSRTRKILLRVVLGMVALAALLIVTGLIVLQTSWFSNFARQKAIAAINDSTGGRTEIGALEIDLSHLTVRIRDFVLHGTEPAGAAPFVTVKLLELKVKLFASSLFDLQYLGIRQPQVNVMVRDDGTTNIPQPKTPSKPSNTSGLETVVNLAVKHFELSNGLLAFLDRKMPLNAQGENLRALLQYNSQTPSYTGNLAMDPIVVTSGSRPPLDLHLNLPVTLERDAIHVSGASLTTAQSRISLTAAIDHLNAPLITAQMSARVSLAEMQRSIDLAIHPGARGAPAELTADANVSLDEKSNALRIRTAHVALGETTVNASGELVPGTAQRADFDANLALAQLANLFGVSSVQPQGALVAKGEATLDKQSQYSVNGVITSRGLGVTSGSTHLASVNLQTPFHADPYLISLDGLRLNVLGGSLAAKVFIERLQNASVEAHLSNFSLPVITAAATGKQLGYDGYLNGIVLARGDLQAKGTTGYNAHARLGIAPGHHGVPLSGQLNADYRGAGGALDVGQSYITFPHSRLSLSGSLNRRIDFELVSHNLSDFLPAVNFGAAKPATSLPVTLQNGGAATINAELNGNTASPDIKGHLEMDDFAAEQHLFSRLALDLAASERGVAVRNGSLAGDGVNTQFDGSLGLVKWSPRPASPVTANLTLHNGDLAALASLAGESSLNASGTANADIHLRGTYGDPLGGAVLQLDNGSVSNQPFSKVYAKADLADQLVTLSRLEIDSAGGQLTASGALRHPRDSFSTGQVRFQLNGRDLQLSQVQAIAKQNAGVAGVIRLAASGAIDIREQGRKTEVVPANLSADLSADNLKVQNQNAGDLTANVRTENGKTKYKVRSDFAGSDVKVDGETALSSDYFTTADASIRNLSIEKSLQLAGQSAIPARGDLSATAHFSGTMQATKANLDFALRKANVYQEPIDSLKGALTYSNNLVDLQSLALATPAGNLNLSGSFNHPADQLTAGSLKLNLSSSDIQLARIAHVRAAEPGLDGTLRLAADVAGNIREEHGKPALLLSRLTANATASALHINKTSLGGIVLDAKTSGSRLDFRLDSDLAQSSVHGSGQAQLAGDYPVKANLSFTNIQYSNLLPFLPNAGTAAPPPYDALVEGKASVNGPVLDPRNLSGRLELDRLDLHTNSSATATGGPAMRRVELQNQGPIVVSLNHEIVNIDELRIAGRDTAIHASGAVNLNDAAEALNLQLDADVNLGLLQDADRDFYSSGELTLNTAIRGSLSDPRANGEIDLKNANINYANAPNGLSNANGVILLNGSNATIRNLTGESGGGNISLAGFVGLGTGVPSFNLEASATKVRVRYSGISATSNASISLTGNLKRSLLAGTVSIERIAYASSSDAGSLLSTASTPPETPSSPTPFLSGMRLAIHVVTAPDIQVVSTYTNRLSVLANLTVRGTASTPGMLGRVTVTDGQLVFFGNAYTVTTGNINFYDPNSISPVLNISLETIAQGVNVTIGVTGPIDDMKLSYRSDPPLTFEQIVQLLATNTTPSNPVIAAHQPNPPQQSLSQIGESAVLGQAVANPLASRVQRVFGLTNLKIDPSFSGSNGQPSARVTLQQKIASNITFTYITDVTQTNAQIVRIQWDLTNSLSAVGLRDFNGDVSIEMFYKFTRR